MTLFMYLFMNLSINYYYDLDYVLSRLIVYLTRWFHGPRLYHNRLQLIFTIGEFLTVFHRPMVKSKPVKKLKISFQYLLHSMRP